MSTKVLVIPDTEKCLLIGKGSFGRVIALKLGVDSQLYKITSSNQEDAAELCPCAFSKPVLKFSTSKHSHESLKREIDIHHRINLSSPCTRSNLVQGIPVCASYSLFEEDNDKNDDTIERWPLNSIIMPRFDFCLHKYLKWRTEVVTDQVIEEMSILINNVHVGIKQLHQMRICHSDLSTGNVLIRMTPREVQPFDVRISDLGNCQFWGAEMQQFCASEYVFYLKPSLFTLDSDTNENNHHQHCGNKLGKSHSRRSSIVAMTTPPKAHPNFDAWSYGVMCMIILMQITRRVDKVIDKWANEHSGDEIYRVACEAKHLVKRIVYICRVFSVQYCKGDTSMSTKMQNMWQEIIFGALCINPQKGIYETGVDAIIKNVEPCLEKSLLKR